MATTPKMSEVIPNISVITVTYNERENIRLFITTVNRIFKENNWNGEIVVVDDNSPDGTSQVVQEFQKLFSNITLITRAGKLGIGSAYFTGFKAAKGKVVAFLDADLSHPPEILPEMYALVNKGNIVFGSRYLGDTKFETDFAHRMGTYMLNRWVRFWLRTGMNDHTNGYLVASGETLHKVLDHSEQKGLHAFDHILYGITIAATAKRLGIPCHEIKAIYHKRKHGETKIPFLWGLRVVFGDLWYVLRVRSKLQ